MKPQKIVVIGGTGLIGKKLIPLLRDRGYDAVAASPSSGVNSLTGDGLAEVLAGAGVLVDVANSPSFATNDVHAFFDASTRNLTRFAKAAGVRHFVALSVVGADRYPESGYLSAKMVQENLIAASGLLYTIVRATQFFEFLDAIAAGSIVDGVVQVPSAPMQPLAADDVALALADIIDESPANGVVEIAGPERRSMADFLRDRLASLGDARSVVESPSAKYFGTPLTPEGLAPASPKHRAGATSLAAWTSRHRSS